MLLCGFVEYAAVAIFMYSGGGENHFINQFEDVSGHNIGMDGCCWIQPLGAYQ